MTVIVAWRHMEVSPPLKEYAEQKVSRLTKYYDRIQEIEVVIEAGKTTSELEVIVHAEHRNMFIARHSDADAYAGIDGCIAKLERQLSEHKKRFRNRKHTAEDKHDFRTDPPSAGLGEVA